jgi:putative tricarboxylic transport membrane protein
MQKNILKDGDVIAGAAAGALGVYITMTASKWTIMNEDGPGPGFFPMGYGIGLILLSAILILSRIKAQRTADEEPTDWAGFARAGGTWVAFVVAAALMGVLGFYISFGLMTFTLVLLVFGRPLKSAFATGLLSAVGFYLVFGLILDVPLPIGVMGF